MIRNIMKGNDLRRMDNNYFRLQPDLDQIAIDKTQWLTDAIIKKYTENKDAK